MATVPDPVAIADRLQAPEPYVRHWASERLLSLHTLDPDVHARAREALEALGPKQAEGSVRLLARRPDDDAGREAVLAALDHAAAKADARVRTFLATALGSMGEFETAARIMRGEGELNDDQLETLREQWADIHAAGRARLLSRADALEQMDDCLAELQSSDGAVGVPVETLIRAGTQAGERCLEAMEDAAGPDVAARLLYVAARTGAPGAAELVRHAAVDRRTGWEALVPGLGTGAPDQAVEQARELVVAGDPWRRAVAARLLLHSHLHESADLVLAALPKEEDTGVAAELCRAAVALAPREAAEVLAGLLRADGHEELTDELRNSVLLTARIHDLDIPEADERAAEVDAARKEARRRALWSDPSAGSGGGGGTRPAPGAAPDIPMPGRNDPCPCGSGRKYKRCHGAT